MDMATLRKNFTVYMKERYPNDSNITSTISMAFFLERYGEAFEMNFQNVLKEGVIPSTYKQMLETYFAERGRAQPSSQAGTYERGLKLLLEYIGSLSVKQRKAIFAVYIPTPNKQEVNTYLEKWGELAQYAAQESALNLLFETYPNNNSLYEVLLKCCTLNEFYSTNLYGVYPMAKHIVSLGIDIRMQSGDPQLVNDIASGHGIKRGESGKDLDLFSFATKYCSRHNSDEYPIYDDYVKAVLGHFQKKDGFSDFTINELRNQYVFKKAIFDFRKVYSLEEFSIKELDRYLWLVGKENFPKHYLKK